MKDRIRRVREDAGLSQRAFGERIGVVGSAVAMLESGRNSAAERTIRAICQEFHVRRRWLETGEAPMYIAHAEDDELIDDVLRTEDEFTRAFIRGIARTPGGWEKMREVFQNISEELEKSKKSAP